MHPVLKASLQSLEDHFRREPRCVGMYLWGSLGNQSADLYSDVDVAVVVREADYPALKQELRAICERLCGEILVWLPEGETENFGNYAFLFETEGHVLLYDFAVVTEKTFPRLTPGIVLFDHTNLLESAVKEQSVKPPEPMAAEAVHNLIETYWVYMYLNGKYFQRGDVYKMLYVQQVLFQNHGKLLCALHPEMEWKWWAKDVHRLPEQHQSVLLVYFGANRQTALAAALRRECDLFSTDAREVCRLKNVIYPDALEEGVRKHFHTVGILSQTVLERVPHVLEEA